MASKTAERRIPARFLLEETEQGFRLTFTADDGTSCSKDFPAEHQPARTDQTGPTKEVLSKLGDTPYVCTDVEVRFSQPWFIPRSTLAEWRRSLIENLKLKIESSSKPLDNPVLYKRATFQSSIFNLQSPLMTCRFCLRHAWGQCLRESEKLKAKSEKWREPLFLVLGDGRRFRLAFDCKKCEMKVKAIED